MKRREILFAALIILAGATTTLVIHQRNAGTVIENEVLLHAKDCRIAEMLVDQQRLSNRLAQINQSSGSRLQHELAGIADEVELLRRQTNMLERQLAETRRTQPQPPALKKSTEFIGGTFVVSASGSKEYENQLCEMAWNRAENPRMGDARNLSYAVRKYARENQGEVPRTFDEAASYVFKGDVPLGGTTRGRDPLAGIHDFDLVYQGSLNELTNVPLQAVALIREREPWPTPAGKWARIYIMAAGAVNVIESDDNFQSWEAEHIIP